MNASIEAYPPEYKGPRPITEQVNEIAGMFDLDPSEALAFIKSGLPDLATFVPVKALPWVNWFAVPSVNAIAFKTFAEIYDLGRNHCSVAKLVFERMAKSRTFYNYRIDKTDSQHLRVSAKTNDAITRLAQQQAGEIHIIAAQLGMCHVGISTRMASDCLAKNEFGLTSVMTTSIALTHPTRLVRWEELGMAILGEEFRVDDKDHWSQTPILHSHDDTIKFNTVPNSTPYTCYGAVTGFLPPDEDEEPATGLA